MIPNKTPTWNIASEIMQREYGFSTRTETRLRRHHYSFEKSCLGSHYMATHMQFSHFFNTDLPRLSRMSFKHDRNLILGVCNRWIDVFDWKKNALKFTFKTKHSQICEAKFLNTGGNGMDIVSACRKGQVRHTCIAPSGYFVSKRIFLNTNQRHKIITVPESPLEFIAASSNSGIFLIDLRSERWSPCPNKIVHRRRGGYLSIDSIAHHPYAPEICVGCSDAFVRVFDKRNLDQPLREMGPGSLPDNGTITIDYCAYNYDGSEILANYSWVGIYLFDNKCYKDGEFLRFYKKSIGPFEIDEVRFFGPKSEFLVRVIDNENILIQDKESGDNVGNDFKSRDLPGARVYTKLIETHPNLPVIAVSTGHGVGCIWAPT